MIDCNLIEATFVTEKESEARKICKELVERHLVASTHCFKVHSNFIWNDKEEDIIEYKVNCLTVENNLDEIEKVIRVLHSYEVFQLTTVAITKCNEDFKNWVQGAVNV